MTIHKQHINVIFHILIWSVLLLLPYFVGSADDQYKIGWMPGFVFTAFGMLHMFIFYVNAYYLAPRFLNIRRWWLYIPLAVLLLGLSFILKFAILKTGYPQLLQYPAVYRFSFAPSVGVFIISIVYRKVIDRIHFERKQKEREAAMLMTELKFLRSQISPHFLFNVMTNLVSLARKRSDQLEPALITLSEFMRYMVYDTQGKKVSLLKETAHLKNYISLQKMRFGNELVEDDIDTVADHYLIEPMLLIPFVENAFKHGTAQGTGVRITIRLAVADDRLFFDVQNGIPLHQDSAAYEQSGVGLQNVVSRLELLYPQKHELKITRKDNVFHVQLKLELL
ncbi:histidine kinase [Niabella ginsenosidivorans]|uniref:Histidine kinase n=1 Tax=Niabella ginsenosidivorans TaxID=1176587 RepID=A0A1A9I3K6_9BACT|nr:histidine kinase [Niabella ginsenosidivorans]ANH81639.1 histidine kinase [Niabella ginsenosidivorans]